MDTRTGEIKTLEGLELEQAIAEWQAHQAGLLKKLPRYVPVDNDKIPVRPKNRRHRGRKIKTYREWCN